MGAFGRVAAGPADAVCIKIVGQHIGLIQTIDVVDFICTQRTVLGDVEIAGEEMAGRIFDTVFAADGSEFGGAALVLARIIADAAEMTGHSMFFIDVHIADVQNAELFAAVGAEGGNGVGEGLPMGAQIAGSLAAGLRPFGGDGAGFRVRAAVLIATVAADALDECMGKVGQRGGFVQGFAQGFAAVRTDAGFDGRTGVAVERFVFGGKLTEQNVVGIGNFAPFNIGMAADRDIAAQSAFAVRQAVGKLDRALFFADVHGNAAVGTRRAQVGRAGVGVMVFVQRRETGSIAGVFSGNGNGVFRAGPIKAGVAALHVAAQRACAVIAEGVLQLDGGGCQRADQLCAAWAHGGLRRRAGIEMAVGGNHGIIFGLGGVRVVDDGIAVFCIGMRAVVGGRSAAHDAKAVVNKHMIFGKTGMFAVDAQLRAAVETFTAQISGAVVIMAGGIVFGIIGRIVPILVLGLHAGIAGIDQVGAAFGILGLLGGIGQGSGVGAHGGRGRRRDGGGGRGLGRVGRCGLGIIAAVAAHGGDRQIMAHVDGRGFHGLVLVQTAVVAVQAQRGGADVGVVLGVLLNVVLRKAQILGGRIPVHHVHVGMGAGGGVAAQRAGSAVVAVAVGTDGGRMLRVPLRLAVAVGADAHLSGRADIAMLGFGQLLVVIRIGRVGGGRVLIEPVGIGVIAHRIVTAEGAQAVRSEAVGSIVRLGVLLVAGHAALAVQAEAGAGHRTGVEMLGFAVRLVEGRIPEIFQRNVGAVRPFNVDVFAVGRIHEAGNRRNRRFSAVIMLFFAEGLRQNAKRHRGQKHHDGQKNCHEFARAVHNKSPSISESVDFLS